jgi:zinc and cadmium transporter
MLTWIIGFSVLGSVGAVAGAAFLGMLPAALAQAAARGVMATVLAGLLSFFVLEKLVLWRHFHDDGTRSHGTAAPLILFGDAFHNFVDGVMIAAAFLVAVPLGVATALAVVAHEVPQEVGDFGSLLDSGYPRGKVLLLNALSAAATLPGAMACIGRSRRGPRCTSWH